MKKTLLILVSLGLSFLCRAQETLTNHDVIKLTKLGLPASTIISKIKNSKTHFDVSVDSLVSLKAQGVSGDVVTEMINANANETITRKDYRDPKTMRKEGLYYYNDRDSTNPIAQLNATMTSGTRSSGTFGSALSGGLVKAKYRSELTGQHANRQIPSARPSFYLYVDPKSTLSPNEFVIIELVQKRNSREMLIGTASVGGAKMGLDGNEKIEFVYEQVADGIFVIHPKFPLDIAEYCFVYVGSMPSPDYMGKVFDFGISSP